MKKKTQTLSELKGEEVRIRDKIEKGKGTLQDVLDLNKIRSVVHKIESILLWSILSLIILVTSGCTASLGSSATVSAFYPKKWESPASRKQTTQPTVGMSRNNEFKLPTLRRGK